MHCRTDEAAAACLLDIHGQHEHQSLYIGTSSLKFWIPMEEPDFSTENSCGGSVQAVQEKSGRVKFS